MKLVIYLLVIFWGLVIWPTGGPIWAQGSCPLFAQGDVNCDGVVDLADIGEVTRVIMNGTSDFQTDINGDGYTNIGDMGKVVIHDASSTSPAVVDLMATGEVTTSDVVGSSTPLPPTICVIERVFGGVLGMALGFVGLAVFLMFIYGGFKWLTAGTNEQNVQQARLTFIYAIAGLALTFGAWFILLFIKNFTGIEVTVFKIPGCS